MHIIKESKLVNRNEDINNYYDDFNEIEYKILSLISKNPISMDAIKLMLNLIYEKIKEMLFEMEYKGKVKQVGGLFT